MSPKSIIILCFIAAIFGFAIIDSASAQYLYESGYPYTYGYSNGYYSSNGVYPYAAYNGYGNGYGYGYYGKRSAGFGALSN